MKYGVVILAFLMSLNALLAQKERGGVGRDGGSRSTQDDRRSQILKQNNDPRFVQFRSVISKQLGKSVREMAADYDLSVQKGIRYEPNQFVALQLAAKQTKIDPTVLAVRTWNPTPAHGPFFAAAQASPTDEKFKENLTNTLVQLTGKPEDEVKKTVENAVQAAPPPQH